MILMYGRHTSLNRADAEIHWTLIRWRIAWGSYGGRIGWEVWTGDIFVIPEMQNSVTYWLLTFSIEVFVFQINLSYYITYSVIGFTCYHNQFYEIMGFNV